jgi:hypothetical protein
MAFVLQASDHIGPRLMECGVEKGRLRFLIAHKL